MNPAGGDNEEEEFLDMDMGDIGFPGLSSSSPGFPIRVYPDPDQTLEKKPDHTVKKPDPDTT